MPIYCESRLGRIELPDEEKPKTAAEIEELTEDEAITKVSPSKRGRWLMTGAPRGGASWSEAGRPFRRTRPAREINHPARSLAACSRA